MGDQILILGPYAKIYFNEKVTNSLRKNLRKSGRRYVKTLPSSIKKRKIKGMLTVGKRYRRENFC